MDLSDKRFYVRLALEQIYEGEGQNCTLPVFLKAGLFGGGTLEVYSGPGPSTSVQPLADHFNIEDPEARFSKEFFSGDCKVEWVRTSPSGLCHHFKLKRKEVDQLVEMGQKIEREQEQQLVASKETVVAPSSTVDVKNLLEVNLAVTGLEGNTAPAAEGNTLVTNNVPPKSPDKIQL
jgi:hypothetical protein